MKQSGLVLMIFVSQRSFQKANPAVFSRGRDVDLTSSSPYRSYKYGVRN